ncbi:MAG: ATP-dependent DNA helicase RecG [Tenericutes bacterium]|nr:ATP-dependent DNA helicase RecG [Mycoplasmatota bacterium]
MKQLEDIKGLGPKTAKKLNSQGIQTINDLLFYFPTKYVLHEINGYEEIELNKELCLEVTVSTKAKIYFIRKNLDKLSVQVKINQLFFNVHIFNRRFLAKALLEGVELVITGKFMSNLSNFTASNIVLKKNFKPGIKAVYHFIDISEATASKIVKEALTMDYPIKETLPNYLLEKRKIPNIKDLIQTIHLPKTEADIVNSRKRIVYEELLEFALRIESLRKLNKSVITIKKEYNIETVKQFISTLDFELTEDQKQATNDIFRDLKNTSQMNRLLQGDVGSGKTIISVIASLACVTAGQQVAIMAPTLVLAKQHLLTFRKYLNPFGVNIELLTSDGTTAEKERIKTDLKLNNIDIVIGTHALIRKDIDFYNLGFIVIDEQHRFGVKQRKILREKGVSPDILLMSATPIPRTLAISIYKDIDISFIKEKPVGRKEIITDLVAYELLDTILSKVTEQLDKGYQAYVICPMINDLDTSKKLSVEEVYKLLYSKLGNKYTIDYLHGKMIDTDKDHILDKFYQNQVQLLVSTTVVEVGVNVLNATVMLVMNADTFGLAQIHQLRGRIGRNEFQSYCYLVVDDLLVASDRLKILKETSDGFLISEYDLSLRGPGEVFGKSQSGIPNFKMADLMKDNQILEEALEDAEQIIKRSDRESHILKNKAIKAIESYNLD